MNGFIKTGANITFPKKKYMKSIVGFLLVAGFCLNTYGQESDTYFYLNLV